MKIKLTTYSRLLFTVAILANCLTNYALAAEECSKVFSQNETGQRRSKLVEQNDVIGFKHHTASTKNVISILLSGRLLSQLKAAEDLVDIKRGYVATQRKDFVYLSPIYNKEFDLIPFTGSLGRYYISKTRDSWQEQAILKFKTNVIDYKNFVHASRAWLYGKFDPRISFLPNDLNLFFDGKFRPRGEFVFQDELSLDFTSVEVWVEPHLRSEVIEILTKANPKVPWENIIKSKQGTPINNPRELSDADFLSLSGGYVALRDLWEIDKNEAVRIARIVIASPTAATDMLLKGASQHIVELFEQGSSGQEK